MVADTTQPFVRTCSVPIPPELGCKRVMIELSVPALPDTGAPIGFAEHVQRGGHPTDMVIACTRGGVVVSADLGASWEWIEIPELSGLMLHNSFTTASGMHLLQGESKDLPDGEAGSTRSRAPLALLDQNWQLVDCVEPGESRWHGSRSIAEAGGVIVYGEYPVNRGTRRPGFDRDNPSSEQLARLRDSRLLRSSNGGRSWEVVLQLGWRRIRHFHTVVADPWQPERWWASSGDSSEENSVWESLDSGLSWNEVSVELPIDELFPGLPQHPRGVLRHTDVAVRETDLIWGADALLGGWHLDDQEVSVGRRAGARLFRSPKEQPWRPRTIGYIGNPVRSLIDVGPAYLVATEAKGTPGYCPQTFLLWKAEPFQLTPLITIDNFRADSPATAFTCSRASRSAKGGVFFSYRGGADGFPGGPGVLRWRVLFD